MRKFFGQRGKQKFFPGTSLTMPLVPLTNDDDDDDGGGSEQRISDSASGRIETTDSGDKLKKLFVVVSDADATSVPLTNTPTTDCRLLSVDAGESNESIAFAPIRQRASTCSGQNSTRYREQNPKKIIEERLRRRSWIVCQSNVCPLSDITLANQLMPNYLRLRRFRLGQSEPNLSSSQMTSSYHTSPSVKTSPRPSLITSVTTTSRRPSFRRPNLSGLNLVNLKHVIRKQLSPQQQPSTPAFLSSDAPHEANQHEDRTNRRWSLTSAPSSSGYGTTSPPSSHYSSFERLQHQQFICTCKQQIDSSVYEELPRLESRSISMSLLDANLTSSPNKLMVLPDQEINTMAYIYKERYPKAKVQMEERLQNFVETYKSVDKFEYCSDGSARFIHNQIVEIAKDCLEKSTNDLITSIYFYEMTDNLERLLLNAQEKCPQAIGNLQAVVRKLLLITARSARLLECLQFDPENFLRTLEEVEYEAKTMTNLKQDIPKYICSKLNLERNPLDAIDGLQTNEEEKPPASTTASLDVESISDLNYLTITPNSTLPPLEHSSSIKGPCEEDFEVLKLISNGAYGAVHLVKHRQTEERYAMKKISKTHLLLRNQIEQVFVERDIMTFTDNPFVVALICTFETKNHLCLVMEYVEGGDVATLLKNIGGPLNIDIARMYFAETTLAVEYLHSYGIIHRDLKPDNLLITAVGHIKLTDFGLSKIGLMSLTTNFYEKLLDKETKTFNDKQICGTPTYIAPEVILRQGYGKPVDWWSMGIILYEFLVGVPPFTGNTPDELFANVINGEIDWDELNPENENDSPEEIFCPDAKNLIEQLLEHDPSKRLGTLAGAYEIRAHPFCSCINWNSLLREKAEFVPVLESPDDTSYFDTRSDRYKHSDGDDDVSSSTTNNDSDSLFASFSSVSLKYVSELSGTHKQRHSSRPENDSASSADISRANSCTDSISSNHIIQIDSPNDFQALSMSQSMIDEKTESSPNLPTFGSGTFEPIIVSSDESESSSKKTNLPVAENVTKTDEKKTTISSTKHSKPRKISLKLLEQQHCIDSGDENQQEKNLVRPHRKSRIPRALSPIKPKSTSLTAPAVSLSNENVQTLASSHKPVTCHNLQQKNSLRSLSKSFSSSSSSSVPSTTGPSTHTHSFGRKNEFEHGKDDRAHRQTHRHNMAISPLERDATLKTEQHTSSSPLTRNLRPPIIIHRGPRSFGFTLRAVKVFHGDTDYYTTQHVVVAVEGPAEAAGLRPNDVITHVNDHPVVGLIHSEVVKLILSGSQVLSIRAIPRSETHIRTGGRRRSPSKQKLRYQHSAEKKQTTQCQKHRVNCPANNTLTSSGTNANKKHPQNTSLFRRLSERKVARDIEAAAAAAGVSLPVPASTPTNNPTQHLTTIETNNPNALSSSLPLLSFNQLTLDPSEWPSLPSSESDSPAQQAPSSLPMIVKQKSQPLMKHDQTVHPSLCKTISEPAPPPPRFSRQNSTPTTTNIYSLRRIYNDQNYFSTPRLPSSKRKLIRQKSINISSPPPTVQSPFTWDNNLTRNIYPHHSDPHTTTESSIRPWNHTTKISYRRK